MDHRLLPGASLSMLLALLPCATAQTTQPSNQRQDGLRSPQTAEQLIEFVQRAAAKLSKEGDGAFDDFRQRPGEWNHGDTYLFVLDLASKKFLFHGTDPSLIGKQAASITGTEGRPLGRWMEEAFEGGVDHTWVFYKWPRPGASQEGTWKATYEVRAKTPSGKDYVIGSGVYDMPVDRKLVSDIVDMASERFQRDGRSTLDLMRDPKGPFVYKDTQAFVVDTQGNILADPLYPALEGKNQLDLKSADGKPILRELIQLIQTRDSGWSGPYLWPRPDGGPAAPRMIFVKRVTVGSQTLGVAAGYYVGRQMEQ